MFTDTFILRRICTSNHQNYFIAFLVTKQLMIGENKKYKLNNILFFLFRRSSTRLAQQSVHGVEKVDAMEQH